MHNKNEVAIYSVADLVKSCLLIKTLGLREMIIFTYDKDDEPSDREFMIALYLEFERLLFQTARKYVSKPEVAEDIVQESLVKLHEKIRTIRSLDHMTLAAYIRSTVRNTSINVLKAEGYEKERLVDVQDETVELADSQFNLDLIMELSRYRELLSKIWPQLSKEDQILLEGKYILGYNDYELAKEIGCKPGSIRMKLTRARRRALMIIREQEGVTHFDKA